MLLIYNRCQSLSPLAAPTTGAYTNEKTPDRGFAVRSDPLCRRLLFCVSLGPCLSLDIRASVQPFLAHRLDTPDQPLPLGRTPRAEPQHG